MVPSFGSHKIDVAEINTFSFDILPSGNQKFGYRLLCHDDHEVHDNHSIIYLNSSSPLILF